ncbi:hypothetical protein F4859DRAFT_520057 [Xylaria cf. heliscus]|nr:hypothetical protein F4859DRAFT_520057 [Xylaria cf. heliscus]
MPAATMPELERLTFQAPEHRQIGDRAILTFSDGSISGANFNYAGPGFPNNLTISFGQIIALAGDFYGNCQLIGDAEQISDQWHTNPEASIKRFLSNTDLLNKDSRGYLQAILKIMLSQEAEVSGDKHDWDWGVVTKGDYLLLALCNWDHFGQDAVSAYSAGHTAALRQAVVAGKNGNKAALSSTYDAYPLSNVPWNQVLKRISNSDQSRNQLPLTLDLLCPTRLLQLRVIDDLNFSVAQYGTVHSLSATTAGAAAESWNLLKQTTVSVTQASGPTTWNAAEKIENGIYSLVGRVQKSPKDVHAYHVGLKVTSDDVEIIWEDEVQDGDSAWTAGRVWYGQFDMNTNNPAMIKHWYKAGSPWTSKLELWTFDSGTQNAPIRKNTEWPSDSKLPPYTAFPLRVQTRDVSDTFVTSALDTSVSPANTVWTFSMWKSGYSKLIYSTCRESVSERAQKTIVQCGSTGSKENRVIRLFYGKSYSKSGYIRIDVLHLYPSSVATISSSEFKVTWSGNNYLTWFLSDVDATGKLALIGLVAADDGSLTVLAFKPKANESSGFESPVVSKITSDKGTLLTASFMAPIMARQASYKYPDTSYQVDSGILMAFDNYGLIGTRLLRSKSYRSTLEYEIGGQLPAVAGQVSATLGRVTRLFETAEEPVGLFIEY